MEDGFGNVIDAEVVRTERSPQDIVKDLGLPVYAQPQVMDIVKELASENLLLKRQVTGLSEHIEKLERWILNDKGIPFPES